MMPPEIANFFLAMQAGKPGAAALAALFDESAVYEEPFSGQMMRHEGREAVIKAMARGWENPMPDMRLEVLSVQTKGDVIELDWLCHSPAIPGGQGQGHNTYLMKNGLIGSLKTTLKGAAS